MIRFTLIAALVMFAALIILPRFAPQLAQVTRRALTLAFLAPVLATLGALVFGLITFDGRCGMWRGALYACDFGTHLREQIIDTVLFVFAPVIKVSMILAVSAVVLIATRGWWWNRGRTKPLK